MTGYAPLQISTYSWSVDNDATVKVFKSYTHTSGLGKKYLHSRADKEQQTYPFFTVKKGTITVKCDITFAAPPQASSTPPACLRSPRNRGPWTQFGRS